MVHRQDKEVRQGTMAAVTIEIVETHGIMRIMLVVVIIMEVGHPRIRASKDIIALDTTTETQTLLTE